MQPKDDLCEYELKILSMMSGKDEPDVIAGAALGACVETLRGRGLITADGGLRYVLTTAGRRRLAAG